MNAYRHLALVAMGAVVFTTAACDEIEPDKEPSILFAGAYPAVVTDGEPVFFYWQTRLADDVEIVPVELDEDGHFVPESEGAPLDLTNCVADLGTVDWAEFSEAAIERAPTLPADQDPGACVSEGGLLVAAPPANQAYAVRAKAGQGRCDQRPGVWDWIYPEECERFVFPVEVMSVPAAQATLTYAGATGTAAVPAGTEVTLDYTVGEGNSWTVGVYDSVEDAVVACDFDDGEVTIPADSSCTYTMDVDADGEFLGSGTVVVTIDEETEVRLAASNDADDGVGDVQETFVFTVAP